MRPITCHTKYVWYWYHFRSRRPRLSSCKAQKGFNVLPCIGDCPVPQSEDVDVDAGTGSHHMHGLIARSRPTLETAVWIVPFRCAQRSFSHSGCLDVHCSSHGHPSKRGSSHTDTTCHVSRRRSARRLLVHLFATSSCFGSLYLGCALRLALGRSLISNSFCYTLFRGFVRIVWSHSC